MYTTTPLHWWFLNFNFYFPLQWDCSKSAFIFDTVFYFLFGFFAFCLVQHKIWKILWVEKQQGMSGSHFCRFFFSLDHCISCDQRTEVQFFSSLTHEIHPDGSEPLLVSLLLSLTYCESANVTRGKWSHSLFPSPTWHPKILLPSLLFLDFQQLFHAFYPVWITHLQGYSGIS